MNNKKKNLIFSILIIIIIQLFLIINNKQKTSLSYFIWKIQEVSIGRLICLSFISGMLMSSILNITLNSKITAYPKNDKKDKNIDDIKNTINNEDKNESIEMPPERDIRDVQPTISVNYRVIKDNVENELEDRKQTSNNSQYLDDWNNNNSEW